MRGGLGTGAGGGGTWLGAEEGGDKDNSLGWLVAGGWYWWDSLEIRNLEEEQAWEGNKLSWGLDECEGPGGCPDLGRLPGSQRLMGRLILTHKGVLGPEGRAAILSSLRVKRKKMSPRATWECPFQL